MDEEMAPIVDIRVVERVRQTTSKEGFNDLVVVSQRLELRRQGCKVWEQLDVVVESADDHKISTNYSNSD